MTRERIKFAVVIWHDLNGVAHPDEGYVIRTAYEQADGTYWIPRPYGNVTPVKLYSRESAAQVFADNLNSEPRTSKSHNELAKAQAGSLARPW
jgi:hypothetical protein